MEDDGLVSREHASFRSVPDCDEVTLEDLKSRNGVHVNGARVERATLVDGDVVRMGSTLFVLRFEDPKQLDVPSDLLVGVSPPLRRARVSIKRVGPSDATLLILGETGTGKEVVARAVHASSRRRGPFIAVNCAAITETLAESQLFGHIVGSFTGAHRDHEGYFRAARGGTVLLDEIGEMPASLQPKLLRALEAREVVPVGAVAPQPFDARIIAATNVDLEDAVRNKSFRGDLYARLSQLRLEIPPLRSRREDILALAATKLPKGSPPLAPDLVEALLLHDWPFNVRELFGVITELLVWGASADVLELSAVRDRLAGAVVADSTHAVAGESNVDRERGTMTAEELAGLLDKHEGNVTAVAREVGRSRTQVYRWITGAGIDPTRYRRPSG